MSTLSSVAMGTAAVWLNGLHHILNWGDVGQHLNNYVLQIIQISGSICTYYNVKEKENGRRDVDFVRNQIFTTPLDQRRCEVKSSVSSPPTTAMAVAMYKKKKKHHSVCLTLQ